MASPAKPPAQFSFSPRRPSSVSIRIEAPGDRAKRLAEEKEEKKKKVRLENEEIAKKLAQEAQQKVEAEKKVKEEKERQSIPSELPRRHPGPLNPAVPSLPSAISTARIIEDLGSVPYPDGIKSPRGDLNINAKDSKFRYVFIHHSIVIKQFSTFHNSDTIAIS